VTYPFSFPNTYLSGQPTNADLWQEDLDALQNEFPLSFDYFDNGVFVKCVFVWDETIPCWAFPPELCRQDYYFPDPAPPALGDQNFDPAPVNSWRLAYARAFADEIKPSGKMKRVGRVHGSLKSLTPMAILLDSENLEVHQVTWDGSAGGGEWKLYSTAQVREAYGRQTYALWTITPGGEDFTLNRGYDPDEDFPNRCLQDVVKLKDSTVLVLGDLLQGGGQLWTVDGSSASAVKMEAATVSVSQNNPASPIRAQKRRYTALPGNSCKLYPNYTGDFTYAFTRGLGSSAAYPDDNVPIQNYGITMGSRIRMAPGARDEADALEVGTMLLGGDGTVTNFFQRTYGADGTVIYPYGTREAFVGGTTSVAVSFQGAKRSDTYPYLSAFIGDHGQVEENWWTTTQELFASSLTLEDNEVNTAVPKWTSRVEDLPVGSHARCVQNFRTYLFVMSANDTGLHWALLVPRPGADGAAQSVCSGSYTTGKGTEWEDVVPRSSTCDGESIYLIMDTGKIWRWDLRLAAFPAGSQGEIIEPRANSTVTTTEEANGLGRYGGIFDARQDHFSNMSFALQGVIANRTSNTGDGDTTVIGPVK
jgi:hypothetical protein